MLHCAVSGQSGPKLKHVIVCFEPFVTVCFNMRIACAA